MRSFLRTAAATLFALCVVVVGNPAPATSAEDAHPLLPFSTRLGGTRSDVAESAAFGPDGALWIAGDSRSSDFQGARRRRGWRHANDPDVCVLRFDPERHEILSALWLGSRGDDSAVGLAFDGNGNAYVAGNLADGRLPGVRGVRSLGPRAGPHGFVARLSPGGTGFAWVLLLPGKIASLAVTASGDPVVCGEAGPDFPLERPLASSQGDVFVARLRADGTGLAFSTRLGGSDVDHAIAVAAAPGGRLLVSGWTNSPDFPATANLLRGPAGSTGGGFLVEIDAEETRIERSALLGDSRVFAIDATPDDLLLLGDTTWADFPAPHAPHGAPDAGSDAFLLRLDPADWSPRAAALFGGSATETYLSMSRSPDGTVWIGGSTSSEDLPVPGGVQPVLGAPDDAFVAAFAPDDFSLLYATYLGGDRRELGLRVAAGDDGSAWLAGATWSSDFPLADPVRPLAPPSFEYDMFLAQFRRGDPPSVPSAPVNLTAEALGGDAIRLRWEAGSADATEFAVYRRTPRGFSQVATLPGGTTEWVDAATLPVRGYSYAVQARNGAGGSAATAAVAVETPPTLDVVVEQGAIGFLPDWFDGTSSLVLEGSVRPNDSSGRRLDPRRDGFECVLLRDPRGSFAALEILPNDRRWRRVRGGLRWRTGRLRLDFDPSTGRFSLASAAYGPAFLPGGDGQQAVRITIGRDAGIVTPTWRVDSDGTLRTP